MKFLALTAFLVLTKTNSAEIPPTNLNNLIRQIDNVDVVAAVKPPQDTDYIEEVDTTSQPVEEKEELMLSATLCPWSTPVMEWTTWFDRDNPTGYGDYETLVDLIKQGKPICKVPVDVNCQTLSGIPASLTGEIVHYSPTQGCYCVNSEQPDKKCNYDYKVRFGCCKQCEGSIPSVWTSWFNRDHPSGYGDYETLTQIIKEGNKVCAKPLAVECVSVSGVPANSTGQIVHYAPTLGCYCVNAEQPDGRCDNDYRVRFKCCQECPVLGQTASWTAWYDRDNPSGYGDYETLVDLIKEGKPICQKPTGVECQTLSGIPASATGEIVIFSPTVGCYCKNADQPDKKCDYDYQVRFKCCK